MGDLNASIYDDFSRTKTILNSNAVGLTNSVHCEVQWLGLEDHVL